MRIVCAFLALVSSWAVAAASSIVSRFDQRLEHTRDTVVIAQGKAGDQLKLATPPCSPCWGEETPYTAFYDGTVTFTARRYDGFDVVLFVPRDGPDAELMTPERIRRLVDRLDLLYRAYRDLLGWAPPRTSDPLGRHVFALLPTRPSFFYGLAVLGGDRTEYHADVMSEDAIDSDVLSNVWVHELAHNFDPIVAWDFGPDAAHDWTTVLQIWYARRQARMDELNGLTFAEFERGYLNQYFQPYLDNLGLTWRQCAATSPRPPACATASAQFLLGGLVATAGKFAEPSAMKAWLRAGVAAGNTVPNNADERIRFVLGSLAQASNTTTQCIAGEFRVPVTVPNQPGGAPLFQGCRDADSDGVKRWYDCDDGKAAVFPGAVEVIDGFDNDCDGTIDEVLVNEATFGGDFSDIQAAPSMVGGVPLEITGTIALRAGGQPEDVDFLDLTPVSPAFLSVRLCNSGASNIELVGQPDDGPAVGPLATAAPGACGGNSLGDRRWTTFWVRRLGAGGSGGGYRLSLTPPGVDAGWPHPRALTLVADAGGGASATVNASRVPGGLANVVVRWSALAGGDVKVVPLGAAGSLTATFPAFLPPHPQRPRSMRASLWRDGMLIEEPGEDVQINSSQIFASGFENVP